MKRVLYFNGQLLTARDLQAEQDYHRDKGRRLNLRTHGWGVVSGLSVSTSTATQAVHVSPGVAIDGYGNEIVVGAAQVLPIPQGASSLLLVISYAETLTDPVSTSSGMQPSRVEEGSKFEYVEARSLREEGKVEVCRIRLVNGNWVVQQRPGLLVTIGAAVLVTAALCRVLCHRWR